MEVGTVVVRIGDFREPKSETQRDGFIFRTVAPGTRRNRAYYSPNMSIHNNNVRLATSREISWFNSNGITNIDRIPGNPSNVEIKKEMENKDKRLLLLT